MSEILATAKLGEKINFIYHELTDLCKAINGDIQKIDFEIINGITEFAVIKLSENRKIKVDVSGLNKKGIAQRVIAQI